MIARILTYDEVNEIGRQSFWEQEVCMDDWDYVVLAPVESIEWIEGDGDCQPYWRQTDDTFDRIMVGCCSNKWSKAYHRGKEYAVGVAYHA